MAKSYIWDKKISLSKKETKWRRVIKEGFVEESEKLDFETLLRF